MAERKAVDSNVDTVPQSRSRRAIILAPLLLIAGAGGGFLGMRRGILPLFAGSEPVGESLSPVSSDIAFIALEPILINLDASESGRFLRFQAQIEVAVSAKAEVASLVPRLMDVLNGYLRAVEPAMLEDRTALVRLKAQMLRRLQMVAGSANVRDLLIMEFVVS